MNKNIQTFQGVTEKFIFIGNANGNKNIHEFDMTFQKKNDEPGSGMLKIRKNKNKQEYILSDDNDILNYIRMTRKKKKPLIERLEKFLSKKTFKRKRKVKKYHKRKKTKKIHKKKRKKVSKKKQKKLEKTKKIGKKRNNK